MYLFVDWFIVFFYLFGEGFGFVFGVVLMFRVRLVCRRSIIFICFKDVCIEVKVLGFIWFGN